MFSIGEALDDLGTTYRADIWDVPYKAQWAAVRQRSERIVLEGHHNWVNGVCAVTVDGKDLLASAADDRTVRIWNTQTGASVLTLPTYHTALAVAPVADSLAIGLDAGILVIRQALSIS